MTVGSTLKPAEKPVWKVIVERSDEARDQRSQYLRQIKSQAEDKSWLNIWVSYMGSVIQNYEEEYKIIKNYVEQRAIWSYGIQCFL